MWSRLVVIHDHDSLNDLLLRSSQKSRPSDSLSFGWSLESYIRVLDPPIDSGYSKRLFRRFSTNRPANVEFEVFVRRSNEETSVSGARRPSDGDLIFRKKKQRGRVLYSYI